jgi:Uncharacterized protein conserved in bacteria
MEWMYLIVPVVANVTAHGVKFITKLIADKNTKLTAFFCSGGIMSAHNATVFSLATLIGFTNGFTSALFALALVFAVVVAYDSVNVRRATGEQGDALKKLVDSKLKPFNAYGHTPIEMILGSVWGILIGILAYLVII